MRVGVPSGTAQFAGVCRAAHQLVDFPRVLEDPLAVPILGFAGSVLIMMGCAGAYLPGVREMRAYIAARSRYAEDRLAQAVAAGTQQYVILGAGLDTFAYRNPHRGLKIFEVDHPDAQAWKLSQLALARI